MVCYIPVTEGVACCHRSTRRVFPVPVGASSACPRRCIRERRVQGSPEFVEVLSGNVKSYPQQVEYQDNEPSDYPTDRADEHGKHVDGYVLGKHEVG